MKKNILGFFVIAFIFAIFIFSPSAVFGNLAERNFPTSGSYSIPTGNGNISADYNYGPKVPEVTWDLSGGRGGVRNVLGQNDKAIYFTPAWFYGPVGRYDISDPFNPKGPNLVQITDNGTAPAGIKGPLNSGDWGHEPHVGLIFPAESADGEARVSISLGSDRAFAPGAGTGAVPNTGASTVSFDSNGQGIFGQQWARKYHDDGTFMSNPGIAVATPSGKYFLYMSRGNASQLQSGKSIGIFDMTDLTGSTDTPYLDTLVGTISWTNVGQLNLVQVPGGKQILLGLTGTGGNATIKAGLINPDTGKLSGVTSHTVPAIGLIRVAYAAGKVYVIIPESFTAVSSNPSTGDYGIGIYSLNTTSLALSKISTVNFKAVSSGINNDFDFSNYTIANAEDGQSTPVLILPSRTYTTLSNGNPNYTDYILNFYSLKNILSQSSSSPYPDFVLHQTDPSYSYWNGLLTSPLAPLKEGDLIVPIQSPFQALLKNEFGKTNLYLYRNAFLLAGGPNNPQMGIAFDSPYAFMSVDDIYKVGENIFLGRVGVRGVYSLRVDRINVTSLGGSSTGTSASTGCAPGNLFNSVTGSPCASCTLSQQFQIGAKGAGVIALQQTLVKAGFTSIKIDGIYGPLTHAAAVLYCQMLNAGPTPVVNPLPTPSPTSTPPVLKTVAGPTSLNINQEGTWTFTATDVNNDNLSWSVDWGEGNSVEICKVNPPLGTAQGWSYSASHSWTTTGNHRVTVFANDCHGGRSQSSFLVNIK